MAAVLGGGFYGNESGNRPLLWALLVSLAIHALVLFALPAMEASHAVRDLLPPITARLAKPIPPEDRKSVV